MSEIRAILSIDKCPIHGFYAICLGDENAGTRLTSSKCCGRWENIMKWFVNADELRAMASRLWLEADELAADRAASPETET